MRAVLVLALDQFLSNVMGLPEVFKDIGIEYFMTADAIKALDKGILLWFLSLDKLQFNAFFSHQPIKTADRSSLPLSRRLVLGKPWVSSSCSSVLTTLAAGRR